MTTPRPPDTLLIVPPVELVPQWYQAPADFERGVFRGHVTYSTNIVPSDLLFYGVLFWDRVHVPFPLVPNSDSEDAYSALERDGRLVTFTPSPEVAEPILKVGRGSLKTGRVLINARTHIGLSKLFGDASDSVERNDLLMAAALLECQKRMRAEGGPYVAGHFGPTEPHGVTDASFIHYNLYRTISVPEGVPIEEVLEFRQRREIRKDLLDTRAYLQDLQSQIEAAPDRPLAELSALREIQSIILSVDRSLVKASIPRRIAKVMFSVRMPAGWVANAAASQALPGMGLPTGFLVNGALNAAASGLESGIGWLSSQVADRPLPLSSEAGRPLASYYESVSRLSADS